MVTGKINIEMRKLVGLLADLEYLVASLDRIGSAALSAEVRAIELDRFVIDGDVFSRLASMRRILAEELDASLSARERESIEEQFEQIKPWTLSQR